MQSKFSKSLIAWSFSIAVILSVVGAMIYTSVSELLEDMARVTHTHIVMGTVAETLSLVKDVETSQRGYIITGQNRYLDPYHAAIPLLKQNLIKLKSLTADNDTQQRHLLPLTEAITNRLSVARAVIGVRRKQGFAAAQRIISTGEGRREMDAIRAGIADMDAEERRLLELRSNNAQSASRFALIAGAGGLLVVIIIVFLILNLVRRESMRRMEVEEGLEKANVQLQDSLNVMQRLTQEMTIIATFAEMLQSCRSESEAYNVIKRTLPQVLPEAAATLGLINASQNLVETVLQIPQDGITPNVLFSPNDCWALRRGHIHLVQDESSGIPCPHLVDTKLTTDDSANGNKQSPPGAMLCLPLMAHGETLGVLTIFAKQDQTLSESDQRVAFAVAEHVSLAVANLKLQQTLRTQSIRDPLSGLFNRRYLEVSFEREIARALRHTHPLSVLMIDIDFFKKFNDSFGHEAGDLLLKEFGGFLVGQCRGEDIACRYGGEEFTIILPETSIEVAQKRADQLRLGTSQLQVEYRRQRLPQITISIGIAAFPIHGTSKEDLMRAADTALYRAKKAGRDCTIIAEPLITDSLIVA